LGLAAIDFDRRTVTCPNGKSVFRASGDLTIENW
jgi:hypothetical protein